MSIASAFCPADYLHGRSTRMLRGIKSCESPSSNAEGWKEGDDPLPKPKICRSRK